MSLNSILKNIGGMLSSGMSVKDDPANADEALALADSQMSYGRYADAERILLSASAREPNRRDLQFKRAEVYFIWGNAEKFLALAQELQVAGGSSDEWQSVVVMGRQLCPNDPPFVRRLPGDT